ncbi:MAG: iron-containing alcohol dehydrogenase [Proteobacteria bacterium]|nr:iron-containing alcohol dehydrogenase [Pseudomonadota bacterium]
MRLDRPGTPKPLVDVGGQPIVVRLINQLEAEGIERVVVVVGYDGKKVRHALLGYPGLRVKLEIVWNPDWEKGLASSIQAASDLFCEPFLLAMADHVFDEELVRLMASEDPPVDGVSALVDPRLDRIFALDSAVKVKLDGSKVVDIGSDIKHYEAVDAGFFAATPSLFSALESVAQEDFGSELSSGLSMLAKRGAVRAVYTQKGSWDDVDTPADLIHVEMRLRRQMRRDKIQRFTSTETAHEGKEYSFVAGEPVTTRIIVGRGFVREPACLGLIPEKSASSPIFVFTDETVDRLYGKSFIEKLKDQGYDVHGIVLPEGEESKSLVNYIYLVERVLSRGVDEQSIFISLGGGVVCNVCGFVASTIYRGLGLVHLPTTLMAQCDAALSHKQAINSHRGKNMVGSYYGPMLVAADVEVLATVPRRLKGDGLAEVIKHAIGQDPSYVEMLLSYTGDIENIDFLEAVVQRNADLKCRLALSDPKELREGMILQYGHTVGHAVEHLSGYRLYHGESVAVGMMVAARVARLLGACGDDLVALHRKLCRRFNLPTTVPSSIRVEDILESLRYNKHYLTEGTRMALLTDVGHLWSVDGDYAIPVSDQVLAEAVKLNQEEETWTPESQ